MQDDDAIMETAGFDAFEFQLANGNNVKVVFAKFWTRLTELARFRRREAGPVPCNKSLFQRGRTFQSDGGPL